MTRNKHSLGASTPIKPTAVDGSSAPQPGLCGRRQALTWIAAAALPLGLGACAAPAPVLRVGSVVFPGYELMFLARDLALLDEHQVRLVEMQSNTDTLRALAAGQLEAAALTLDELMTARADGVDLRVVAVLDVSLGADVVLARAPATLQTLAGKRVGVEDGAMGAVMLNALLFAAKLDLNQIQKIPMTLDRSEEFFNHGRVDVVVTAQPWGARLEKVGAVRLFDSAAIPGRILDVLAVRASALTTHTAALKALVAAHFLALKHWQTQAVDASARMALRLQTPPAEVAALFMGLQLPDAMLNRTMLLSGGTVDQTTQALQRVMLSAGLLRASADWSDLVDAQFLPI